MVDKTLGCAHLQWSIDDKVYHSLKHDTSALEEEFLSAKTVWDRESANSAKLCKRAESYTCDCVIHQIDSAATMQFLSKHL